MLPRATLEGLVAVIHSAAAVMENLPGGGRGSGGGGGGLRSIEVAVSGGGGGGGGGGGVGGNTVRVMVYYWDNFVLALPITEGDVAAVAATTASDWAGGVSSAVPGESEEAVTTAGVHKTGVASDWTGGDGSAVPSQSDEAAAATARVHETGSSRLSLHSAVVRGAVHDEMRHLHHLLRFLENAVPKNKLSLGSPYT